MQANVVKITFQNEGIVTNSKTGVSNQNSRTFQGQVSGLKITEAQGSAISTHIFPLYKAPVRAQETTTCSTETALGRPPHKILRFKDKAALRRKVPICTSYFTHTVKLINIKNTFLD